MAENPVFTLRSLNLFYGEKQALKDVSLDIPAQRVTVLIGPSGCGKSSTLRCLNRMVEPRQGSLQFQGKDVSRLDPISLRRKMGYAIQKVGLIPHMTVEQNISLVPRLLQWSREKQQERSDELLGLIQLNPEEYRHKYPSELSGGEAQRVGVARALSADPPVLLMDEPFGAVDPLNRQILQDEFIRIQRKLKKTVVFVTHDLEEALRLADYLVIMKEGRIEQAGTPGDILSAPANPFVEDFLGQDRALKNLTLYTADLYLKELTLASGDKRPYQWITPSSQGIPDKIRYSLDGKTREAPIGAEHMARPYSSLKECLSLMLARGLPAVPVISNDQQILGEVRYEDIQQIQIG